MRRHTLAALTALALALTACADTDDPEEVAATGDDTTGAPAETAEADDGGGDVVEITAVDYAFEDVPETVPAGTELTLVNEAEGEVHEMIVYRVDDAQTMTLEEILQGAAEDDGPPPEWLTFAGMDVALPGGSGLAPEGPVVLDEPGRYLLLCFIPTGADPAAFEEAVSSGATEAPQVDGGPPHVAHGMAAELRVE